MDQVDTRELVECVGMVESVVYRKEADLGDASYSVLRLSLDSDWREKLHYSLVDKQHQVTVCGAGMEEITPGEKIRVQGWIKKHRTFGRQIEAESITIEQPRDLYEIEKFLIGNVKLINHVLASRIVQKFGKNTIEIINSVPDRLREVEGIGEKRLQEIISSWAAKAKERELLVFFTNIGLSGRFKDRILKAYEDKDKAVKLILEDPYRLARDIDGIGFTTADTVAKRLNIEETSEIRIRAAALHLLEEAQHTGGHMFLPEYELASATTSFLNHRAIPQQLVEACITNAIDVGIISREDNRLYSPRGLMVETRSAQMLVNQMKIPLPAGLGEQAIKAALDASTVELDPMQVEGITKCLTSKVSVMTGGPGVGKTTCLQCMVHGFDAASLPVHLLAPTGRAAKRMSEVIGRPASTIHRAIWPVLKQGDTDEPAEMLDGAIIIDESSMIDQNLLYNLLRAVTPQSILVFVGDYDQLPSVGPGAVLRDLIRSEVIPTTRLTKIFRQAAGSDIIINAHGINQGRLPKINQMSKARGIPQNTDMLLWEVEEPEKQLEAVRYLVEKFGPKRGFDPINDIQVISPGHNGIIGVRNLNVELQKVLNPNPSKAHTFNNGIRWGVGDKIMNTKNNIDLGIANGELGVISDIDEPEPGKTPEWIDVDFGDLEVRVPRDWFTHMQLAYASTVHKMQGSEFPFVIIILHMSHYMLLQRQLLYTGETRPRKFCVIVAQPSALGRALSNAAPAYRNSYLAERLQILMEKHGSTIQ